MSISILEMFGEYATIGQITYSQYKLFNWSVYNTNTNETILIYNEPDITKCIIGTEILNKDVYGVLIFSKLVNSNIDNITLDDIPDIVSLMLKEFSF